MSKSKATYCPVNGKQCFDRRSQAEKVAYSTKKRLRCTRRGSVYLCEYCGKYHVTHYSYEVCKDFKTMDRKHIFAYLMEYDHDTNLQPTRSQIHGVSRQVPCTIKTRLS